MIQAVVILLVGLFISTDALPEEEVKKCLASTNEMRQRHYAPPLKWSDDLAREAQAYADKLMAYYKRKGTPALIHDKHNAEKGWGENLYWSDSPRRGYCADAEVAWYTEILDLDNTYNIHKVGHFTQEIWDQTTHVGFGIATIKGLSKSNKNNYDTFIVAKYSPPGNMYRSGHRTEDFDAHCHKVKPEYKAHLIPEVVELDKSLCKNFLPYCSKLKKHCNGSLRKIMKMACYPTCQPCPA